MSKFSGKCDVYDIYGDWSDEQLQKSEFYLGRNPIPLRINSQHDLAPYYPYLTGMSTHHDGVAHVVLSDRSFIDSEEEEYLTWRLKDFQRYYRKCKRDKTLYDPDEALKKVCWFTPSQADRKIAERVGIYGNKATIEGLHGDIYEYYRNELLEEMVNLGWMRSKAAYWIWKDWKLLTGKEASMDGTN